MHQCNGLCGLCCLLRPSVDPYRRQRLPRGWRSANFIGPYRPYSLPVASAEGLGERLKATKPRVSP